ncbi:ABC transporter ATP-binding protein [Deinococcus peraridilitoris]|uniref:ABC-type multidrug transport system, ATPase component n=1 Tax=Deinococcus peraridilitoris (strain DSM 19664 / LMG 22246 / CIP 109416 / KR-200) TaxID=937777 RepID=L0A335_DEIPD|nr:ABC transporter ATP-binding protein [Deinococcus peraridilitoris]AFZ67854.1 ABC-type multidrug transport system, ATPase component [Deinococcus peraridilitoris DSM 19664]
MTDRVIHTRALAKLYRNGAGLKPLDLEVQRGEIFGFLGPNGAGKTTTIRTLLGYVRPTSGSAQVLGLDIARQTRQIHARVGYLPGELRLDPGLTGWQLFDLIGRLRGGYTRPFLTELTERLALDPSRRLGTLSKGNKQKVGLIAALMGQPDLLILDEPTDGLDPLVHDEVLQLLREARAEGRTVFLSSHVLAEVDRVADRVGIIRAGELVTVASVAQVKARLPHRLEVRFAYPVPDGVFKKLTALQDAEMRGDTLHCVLVGDADGFIKTLAAYHVLDVRGREPNLEDAFLTYYREEHHVV